MSDFLYLNGFKFLKFIIKKTPTWFKNSVLNFLVSFLYLIDKKHRTIIETNLKFAFGEDFREIKQITKNCYKNLVYFLADFIDNQDRSLDYINSKINIINQDIVQNAIATNRAIIFITAHYSNWEILPLVIGGNIAPMTVVGRSLDSKVMNTILKSERERFNITMVDKKGASKELVKALKAKRAVGVLIDQSISLNHGIEVSFFGKRATQTSITSILAKKFDALIIPTFVFSQDEKYDLKFYEPIEADKNLDYDTDIQRLSQMQSDIIEKVIREKPNEWFWFHKRWKVFYPELY